MNRRQKLQKQEKLRRVRSLEREAALPRHLWEYGSLVVGAVSKILPIVLGARLLFDFYLMDGDLKKVEECRAIIRSSSSPEVIEEATHRTFNSSHQRDQYKRYVSP